MTKSYADFIKSSSDISINVWGISILKYSQTVCNPLNPHLNLSLSYINVVSITG